MIFMISVSFVNGSTSTYTPDNQYEPNDGQEDLYSYMYQLLLCPVQFLNSLFHMYILIEKYTTFHLKSIPLISANLLLWDLLSNTKRDDEYGYKTGNHETLFSGG